MVVVEFRSEADVLAHGFRFRPAWWVPRVPEEWGDFLEQLPVAERGYRTITRADVLDTANNHGLPQALLAGYVWGTGNWAFLVGRRARVFRDNDVASIGDSLQAAAAMLRRDNTVEAYAAMLQGPHHLKHLGPSFFTKFLYAADACGGQPGRALILDQFVAVALKATDGWDISRRGPWDPSTYAKWIDHAHTIASAEYVRADASFIGAVDNPRLISRPRRSSGPYRAGSACRRRPLDCSVACTVHALWMNSGRWVIEAVPTERRPDRSHPLPRWRRTTGAGGAVLRDPVPPGCRSLGGSPRWPPQSAPCSRPPSSGAPVYS